MKFTTLASLAVIAACATGCGHATFASSPGAYSARGTSYNPEAMAATLSANNVAETNAQTYQMCVASGRCYGYMGGGGYGGYGNDYQYYWGNAAPPRPIAPPVSVSAAAPKGSAEAVDVCARAMAEDSLRAQAGKPLKGLPPGCEWSSTSK